jgi:hypothetical protein
MASQGQGVAAIVQIEQGLATLRATGAGGTGAAAMSAETYGCAGQTEAGLAVLAEAFASVDSTGERNGEAELYRVKGELLLQSMPQRRTAKGSDPRATEAEGCFHQALDSARQQQAKARELPTALSVSRLWQAQGKAAAARTLLAEVSGWFTEGFDTADLPEAQTLLQALGRNEMDPPPVRNLPVLGNTTLCISPSQNPSTAHPSEIQ